MTNKQHQPSTEAAKMALHMMLLACIVKQKGRIVVSIPETRAVSLHCLKVEDTVDVSSGQHQLVLSYEEGDSKIEQAKKLLESEGFAILHKDALPQAITKEMI